MKGIFILSFHKKPGAFVDREFPENITDQMGINKTEQNKIYSLHRMRNTRPNYLFVKVKKHQIASFFSGFNARQFIGRPNHCICIILDQGENPMKWEDQLRRLTYDLLPQLDEIRGDEVIESGLDQDPKYKKFDRILEEKFNALKNGEIEPMREGEGEHLEGTGAVIEKISSYKSEKTLADDQIKASDIAQATELAKKQHEKEEKAKAEAEAQKQEEDEISAATKQMEMMEVESLREEVRNLHNILKSKNNRINSLESQLTEARTEDAGGSGDLAKIKGEYEALISSKEEELETWRNKVSDLNEELFIKQDNLKKTTEMMMQMTMDAQKQAQKMRELRKRIKKLEVNQTAPHDLNEDEVSTLRSHLAEVEESLKDEAENAKISKKRNKKLFMKNKKLEDRIEGLEEKLEEKENKINTLKEKTKSMKKKLDGLEDKLEKNQNDLKAAKRKIKIQRREITIAKKGVQPVSKSMSTSPDKENTEEQFREYEQRIQKYKKKAKVLKSKLRDLEEDSEISKEQAAANGNDSERILREKIKQKDRQIEDMETELVKAKKTIKVQRRENKHLKEILDL